MKTMIYLNHYKAVIKIRINTTETSWVNTFSGWFKSTKIIRTAYVRTRLFQKFYMEQYKGLSECFKRFRFAFKAIRKKSLDTFCVFTNVFYDLDYCNMLCNCIIRIEIGAYFTKKKPHRYINYVILFLTRKLK